MGGEPVTRLFYRDHDNVCQHPSDIPFLNQQTRIVLENCGNIDAESIDEYIAAGGFQAMAKAFFDMTPQEVIDEVTRSGHFIDHFLRSHIKEGFGHSLESACCNIFVNRFCIDVTAVFKNNPGLLIQKRNV